MGLNKKIEYFLQKTFTPDARIDDRMLGKDLTFITNENGEPVTLFIGTRREDGAISGERYVRKIVRKPGSQQIQKSHWDLKGKVVKA
ncbi:hypothetical protein H8S95_04815 [Pontibacter sp. KCTC 32443]|uniref:hypothetical protein n=1 Tax=Pontibacter TaxID=323449 RepID=UPI00164E1616|nr:MULTISPECIES: hypothetical protein [Pontibacter]MBC5773378.1 hypothetical protein [Pontibacter sp. KCTC 32443]